MGIASIGCANELVIGFIFFGAEESKAADAFLFFTAARSAALVFFTSDADGRIGVEVGVGERSNNSKFSYVSPRSIYGVI